MAVSKHYDVIVAGGGAAGTAAAVASARTGAKTLLIERHGCLGGAAAVRNVLTLCGLYTLAETPQLVAGGIAKEVLMRLRQLRGVSDVQRFRGVFVAFEPEALKRIYDELVTQSQVEMVFCAQICGVGRDGDRITDITYVDHGGTHRVSGAAFVDCTGDGDLAALGDAATRYGNQGAVNLGTLGIRIGGVGPDVTVTADDYVQAIEARGHLLSRVTKKRCVVVRLPVSADLIVYLASEDYDPRNAASLAAAEIGARRQAWDYLYAIQGIKGCEHAYLVSTGPEIGTRESRHIDSLGQLTWDSVQNRARFNDVIGLGAWGAEWHDRKDWSSSFDYPPQKGAYQIPLSCLHSKNTANLFAAGRLADGDRLAGAAIRVMGTAMVTGQAAGVAAAFTAQGMGEVSAIQHHLREQGCWLTPEACEAV
ncbi:MAG: FAD-dependent oxidoreductase [Betaproteobacteria bacterium]|nr:FAD-dependent oxidoreductase [Candidatus Fonsibacter lacus]